MKKTSLAEAKAHLSALVDDAEHRRTRTVILRHGKPAAAIVPLDLEPRRAKNRTRFSVETIKRIFSRLGATSTATSAVADLLSSRR